MGTNGSGYYEYGLREALHSNWRLGQDSSILRNADRSLWSFRQ